MLVNFFSDTLLREQFDLTFSYRHSPEYQSGFQNRFNGSIDTFPLSLPDLETQIRKVRNKGFRLVVRLIAWATGLKYFYLWRQKRQLKQFLERRKIDLLHVNNGGFPGALSCNAAALAARDCGVQNVVYVVNNVVEPYTQWPRWFDRFLDRGVSASVERFVTGSRYAGDKLKDVLDLPDEKVTSIPNGISPREIVNCPEQIRARLGLRMGRSLFCVVAVLEPRKGHMALLEALKVLRNSVEAAEIPDFVIEGVGSQLARLEAYVKEAGLESIVRFVGREKNVFDLINACDVLVLPSISHEDFPNVILEAMSLGKPVISSAISGIPEQVENGITGMVVAPGDVFALSQAILQLARNSQLRDRMGKAGAAKFNACFEAAKAVRHYQVLYSELLS